MDRHPAWRSQAVLLIGVIILLPFGLGLILLASALYQHYAHTYELDGAVLRHTQGIVARSSTSVRVTDLCEIKLSQSFAGRLMNYGDLRFSTAASTEAEVHWRGIVDPLAIRTYFEHVRDNGNA